MLLGSVAEREPWSRNYLRPGAGAEIIFLINIFYPQFGLDAGMKKNLLKDYFVWYTVLPLKYSFKWQYMAGAGAGAGAESMDKGGAGAKNIYFRLRNTASGGKSKTKTNYHICTFWG